MQNQTKAPPRAHQPHHGKTNADPEAKFCLWLLLLTIFEVILLIVVLVRTYKKDEQPTPVPNDREVTTDENVLDTPTPSVPVFAGGTVIPLPSSDADTATLSGEIGSQFAVLVDAETGKILASKNADAKLEPASMTKVMTLIVACEMLTESDLDREVTMTEEMLQYVTTGAYRGTGRAAFDPGDKIRIKDLLYGIGVQSFADCTIMVVSELCPASTVAESEQKFVALMNQKARDMGLSNTNFDNIVGHESENNYSTATEIAAIMMYGLNCPLIKDILSVPQYVFYISYVDENNTPKSYRFTYYSTLFNANPNSASRIKAYEEHYNKTFSLANATFGGGKTGSLGEGSSFTYSLVSYATKGGKTYVVVTGDTTLSYTVMNDAKIIYDTYLK